MAAAGKTPIEVVAGILKGTHTPERAETQVQQRPHEAKPKKKKLQKKAKNRTWLALSHYQMDVLDKMAKGSHPMVKNMIYKNFLRD